jgi:hypothetical protein
MSMSTQHGGGSRRPSTRPVAGAKRKQGGDESPAVEKTTDSSVDSSVEDSSVEDTSVDNTSVEDTDESTAESTAEEKVDTKPKAKASPRKSAPARKPGTAAKKTTSGKPGSRPAAKTAGRRVAPVKVNQERNWGPIALFAAVGVIAVAIIGFAGYQVYQNGLTWQERAARIDGVVNYLKKDPGAVNYTSHQYGPVQYKYLPPFGGTHNPNWQRCLGDVYPAAIASEHAVHSLEHGAVWITYNPSLPADQVEALAKKVRGQDFMLMSPFPNQDKPISLQVWGYQLKVDNANDPRIDQFIRALKQKAALEQGATCSSGNMITETGTTPRDLGKDQPQQGG